MTYHKIQDGGVADVCAVWELSSFIIVWKDPDDVTDTEDAVM